MYANHTLSKCQGSAATPMYSRLEGLEQHSMHFLGCRCIRNLVLSITMAGRGDCRVLFDTAM